MHAHTQCSGYGAPLPGIFDGGEFGAFQGSATDGANKERSNDTSPDGAPLNQLKTGHLGGISTASLLNQRLMLTNAEPEKGKRSLVFNELGPEANRKRTMKQVRLIQHNASAKYKRAVGCMLC